MFKDAWVIHASCGGFLSIMEQFKAYVPQADYAASEHGITEQFNLGILDPDIITYMESNVPPISLDQVSFVRSNP